VSEAALLAATTEAPNDDGPRLVYADWLLQQDDEIARARGEYIALACSAMRSPKRTSRMKELLAKWEIVWLASINPCIRDQTWARGFVEACRLSEHVPESLLGHPLWRTLRILQAETYGLGERVRVICQPALESLRTLATDLDAIEPIAVSAQGPAHLPRLIELAILRSYPARVAQDAVIPILTSAPCFTKIRRLHLDGGCTQTQLAALARPDLTLAVGTHAFNLGRWIDELDEAQATYEEVRLVSEMRPLVARGGIELVIRRDADGRWSQLEIRWTEHDTARRRNDVLQTLELLPRDRLTRVSFVGPTRAEFDVARWRARIRTALRLQTTAAIE
jgi:uncharacterized protein (TIGR02996 family)